MLDPDSSTSIIFLVFLLAFHAISAAAKESITSIRKSRRLQLIEENKPAARLVDNLAENTTLLVTTEQFVLKFIGFLLIALVVVSYTTALAQAAGLSHLFAAIVLGLVSALVVLFLGDLLPREIARNFAEPIALWTIYPFYWLSRLVAPLTRLVSFMGRILTGRLNEVQQYNPATITEEDLLSYVDVGEEEGVLKEDERDMIYSIIDLDDTSAREIMVPRIDIVAVEANTSLEEAVEVAIQAGHSRLPVYVDTIDNIIGVLYVKDLLGYWHHQNPPASIQGLERAVYYVPETKPVSELLRELQSKKVHIAIVVDEYGGTAGLVTIEDVLEEIVGEIQDEHDADEFYMQYISDDEYIFSARMDLDDINNVMSIELPTDESDTLGGLIYNVLGRIPEAGDSLSGESFGAPDIYFTVLDVDGRRIKRVKVTRLKKENNPPQKIPKTAMDPKTSTLINNTRKTLSESS